MIRRQHLARHAIPVLVLAMALSACSKKPGATVPKSADKRVEQMASILPATTEAGVLILDVTKAQSSANAFKSRVGEDMQQVKQAQGEIKKELGFDPLDPESVKQAGLAPNNSLVLVSIHGRPVALTYVADRQKFDSFFTSKMQERLKTKAAPTSKKEGAVEIKQLGDKPAEQVAWTYVGKLAVIGGPIAEAKLAEKAGPVTKTLASIATADPKKSPGLSTTPIFKKTRAQFADSPIQGFLNVEAIAKNPDFKAMLEKQMDDPAQKRGMEWMEKNAEGLAFGAKATDTRVDFTLLLATKGDFTKKAQEIIKGATKSKLGGFASDKMLIGIRSTVNFDKAWSMMMANAPEKERKEFKTKISMASEQLGVDVQKDIIGNFTGNLGVYSYGLDIKALFAARMTQNPVQLLQGLNLIVALQFKDAGKLKTTATAIVAKAKESGAPFEAKDTADGLEIPLPMGAGRIMVKGDLLLYAPPTFSDEQLGKMISGKGGKAAGALGKQVSEPAFSGLYLDAKNIMSTLKTSGLPIPATGPLNDIKEVAVSTSATDAGGLLQVNVELNPPAKAAAPPKK